MWSDFQRNLLRVSMMHLSILVDVQCGGILSMRWLLWHLSPHIFPQDAPCVEGIRRGKTSGSFGRLHTSVLCRP
jgi:hypothetical protein